MRRFFPLLLIVAPAVLSAQTGSLSDRVAEVMARPAFRHAMFGVKVAALDQDTVLFSVNPDKLFVPGSTTKLVTTGTALGAFGSDFRFRTRVYRTGPVTAGVLTGDLVLVASGDPNLSHRIRGDSLRFVDEDHSYGNDPATDLIPGDPLMVMRELAGQIKAHGIRRITGQVRIDLSLFEANERELGTGVMLSPIVVNDNIIDLIIAPGDKAGALATVTASPATGYLRVINRVVSVADSAVPVSIQTDSLTPGGTRVVILTGRKLVGKPAELLTYKLAEPDRFAAWGLTQALRDAGVTVTSPRPGGRAARTSTADDIAVAEHVSPPFREAAKVILKVSQNLHASLLPYIVGALKGKEPTPQGGFDYENTFLKNAGLELSGAVQSDGAGGAALYTPNFIVAFLTWMSHQPYAADYVHALPILGTDGTLAKISRGAPAAGHVFAKTGTFVSEDKLNRGLVVDGKGLGGYVTTRSGRRLVFAIYINRVKLTNPADISDVVGQAAGDIAAAIYDTVP